MLAVDTTLDQRRAYAAAAAVPDPEVPCVTVADLGILRSVEIVDEARADTFSEAQVPLLRLSVADARAALPHVTLIVAIFDRGSTKAGKIRS